MKETKMNDCVLIVDDDEVNRIILREILSGKYEILEAENGAKALEILRSGEYNPHAVLLDIMMPEMDGFAVLKEMKRRHDTAHIPVLFITAANDSETESRGLSEGAVDYIHKPFIENVIRARVDNHIQLCRYRESLEQMLEQKTSQLVATHERTMETLATVIEYRNLESGLHIRRTVELTRVMVEYMLQNPDYYAQLTKLKCKSLIKAAALHDVGKIGVPDEVLLKPGKLTPGEFEVIKTHTVIGSDIIDQIFTSDPTDETGYLARAREICLYHHERWDGKGYPEGLKGGEIPLSARILSVLDVYDALISPRVYKPAFTHEKSVEIIAEGSGTQFDPAIVGAFCEIADTIKFASMSLQDDTRLQV